MFHSKSHNHYSYKQAAILYLTVAGVLWSLLLDLNNVNVESSIFVTDFENLIISYF